MITFTQAKKMIKDADKDTVKTLIERFGEELVFRYWNQGYNIADMEEAYQGEHDNDADFVQQLLEDCGDIPKLPHYVHIDWELTARDVMMDYFEIDGHYFRSL